MSWRPRRDSLVIMVGVLSAGALIVAALVLVRTPQRAAEAELARVAGEAADAVVAEWGRILRAEAPPFEAAGGVRAWDPGAPDATSLEGVELPEPGAGSAAAVLLAEARRLDQASDVAGALEAALQAATASSTSPAQARVRLRAIQLAARAGRGDVAREQWEAAREALSGDETIDGCSALLLCFLAAAPALEPEARAPPSADLAVRLEAGRLALPEADVARSLAARLGTLAGDDTLADRLADRQATSALRVLVAAAPTPPAADRWTVQPAGSRLLVDRSRDDGSVLAFLTGVPAVQATLQRVLTERSLVPDGFEIALEVGSADADVTGVTVRDRTPLVGDVLGFTVRHQDPGAFVTAERRRALWVQSALFVMASFSLSAALSTARAMRRERALAGLRSAFIASVSHELRTPVTSILLLVENLESGRTGADAPGRYHALLRREAHRLRRIVDDVLDMSRLERGRSIELRRDVVDLPAFAADLVEEGRELAARSDAELHAHLGELPATAALDADALRRAVLNLVDNAGKHAAGGAVELEIAALPGGRLRIAVADRGPGVPAGQRQRIFEPFARGAADGAGPPGAGLGLSIVRAIVRGHGGEVAVRDRDDGPGAVFELEFPAEAPVEDLA